MTKIKNAWLRIGTQAEELGFPPQSAVMLPLLQELALRGGATKPRSVDAEGRNIYEALAAKFLGIVRANNEDTKAWENTVRWSKQRLVRLGCIDSSQRGVWRLTRLGSRCVSDNSLAVAQRGGDNQPV